MNIYRLGDFYRSAGIKRRELRNPGIKKGKQKVSREQGDSDFKPWE